MQGAERLNWLKAWILLYIIVMTSILYIVLKGFVGRIRIGSMTAKAISLFSSYPPATCLWGHPKMLTPAPLPIFCLEIIQRQITMMGFGRCFSWRLLERGIINPGNWLDWCKIVPNRRSGGGILSEPQVTSFGINAFYGPRSGPIWSKPGLERYLW